MADAGATVAAAGAEAAEKKELTREQLLLYCKKLKVRRPLLLVLSMLVCA